MLDRVVVLDPGAQVLEGCGCVPALVGSVHEVDGPDSRPQCVNFGSQSSGQGHGYISAQSSLTQNDKGRTRKSNPCLPHSGRGLRQWTRILCGSVSQGFAASTCASRRAFSDRRKLASAAASDPNPEAAVRPARGPCGQAMLSRWPPERQAERKTFNPSMPVQKGSDTVGEFAGLAESSTYVGKSARIVASIRTEIGFLSFLAQP